MSCSPAKAATVLLLRPGRGEPTPEIFTITRSPSLAFSPGVSAFPGGRVDAADELPAELWAGVDLKKRGDQLQVSPRKAGMILAAAVRETFEETGVLLAQDGNGKSANLSSSDVRRIRQQVEAGGRDFSAFLLSSGLQPDVASLRPLSRWITPKGRPRRYDTYFLLAAMPTGQQPGPLSLEVESSRWTTATEALTDFRAGKHDLMAPTWAQFRSLMKARSLTEALAVNNSAPPVMPRVLTNTPLRVVNFHGHKAFARDLAESNANLATRPF